MRKFLAPLCLIALLVFPAAASADTSFAQYLGQLETMYQLPSGILWKVALAENGGKSSGCAPTSSACGMFQFISSTWETATKAMFGQPLNPTLRDSPDISAKVTAYELDVIKNQIGSTITQAKVSLAAGLYLGHFLGAGGARTLLLAYIQNPGENACSLLASACAANRSVLSQSVSGVINWASQKMQVTGVPNVAGNFADNTGVSYAYSYSDIPASGFLPANTVIPASPYGQYATVFPSVTNGGALPAPTGTSLPLTSLPSTTNTNTTGTTGTTVTTTSTSGSACTPQYYCSNSTVYYESDSCSTNVFEQCQYGCLGTICASAPSASSSSQLLTTTPIATTESSNTGTASEGSSFTSGLGTSSSFSLGSEIATIVQGGLSSQNSASNGYSSSAVNPTFESDTNAGNSFDAAQTGSPLSQMLDQLKNALVGLLNYLGSL